MAGKAATALLLLLVLALATPMQCRLHLPWGRSHNNSDQPAALNAEVRYDLRTAELQAARCMQQKRSDALYLIVWSSVAAHHAGGGGVANLESDRCQTFKFQAKVRLQSGGNCTSTLRVLSILLALLKWLLCHRKPNAVSSLVQLVFHVAADWMFVLCFVRSFCWITDHVLRSAAQGWARLLPCRKHNGCEHSY